MEIIVLEYFGDIGYVYWYVGMVGFGGFDCISGKEVDGVG